MFSGADPERGSRWEDQGGRTKMEVKMVLKSYFKPSLLAQKIEVRFLLF